MKIKQKRVKIVHEHVKINLCKWGGKIITPNPLKTPKTFSKNCESEQSVVVAQSADYAVKINDDL